MLTMHVPIELITDTGLCGPMIDLKFIAGVLQS